MHSKIIELSERPVPPEEQVSEDAFYEGFTGWIADYVDEYVGEENKMFVRMDFIDTLSSIYPDHITSDVIVRDGMTCPCITFKRGFREEHESRIVEKIKGLLDSGKKYGEIRYQLITLISDQFGLYIYRKDYGLETLEDFLCSNIEGKTFYFGNIVDYHF